MNITEKVGAAIKSMEENRAVNLATTMGGAVQVVGLTIEDLREIHQRLKADDFKRAQSRRGIEPRYRAGF